MPLSRHKVPASLPGQALEGFSGQALDGLSGMPAFLRWHLAGSQPQCNDAQPCTCLYSHRLSEHALLRREKMQGSLMLWKSSNHHLIRECSGCTAVQYLQCKAPLVR